MFYLEMSIAFCSFASFRKSRALLSHERCFWFCASGAKVNRDDGIGFLSVKSSENFHSINPSP